MTWIKDHVGILVVCAVGVPLCTRLVINGYWLGFLVAALPGWAAAIYDTRS